MNQSFFAPGKLLLSAEYSVLQGAKAVAVPTKLGQRLEVEESDSDNEAGWKAYDHKDKPWLDFEINHASNREELLVQKIIAEACTDKDLKGTSFRAHLDFPREWGLGSSSTFISLIAQWAGKDVWPLFFKYLKGSGYDVAVAQSGKNLMYWLEEAKKPMWKELALPKIFEKTLLIYLGQKQNSASEVVRFEKFNHNQSYFDQISALSEGLLAIEDIASLQDWMVRHEALTGEIIQKSPLKAQRFPKLEGSIKSLGAWGGDFAWYAGPRDKEYFKSLGYHQVFSFYELVQRI